MISHHDGALKMVKDLKEYPGAAYDPILNEFVSDLVNDQSIEIERMNIIAVNLSDDPRSKLRLVTMTQKKHIKFGESCIP